jgi:hypothetical protein
MKKQYLDSKGDPLVIGKMYSLVSNLFPKGHCHYEWIKAVWNGSCLIDEYEYTWTDWLDDSGKPSVKVNP